MNAKLVFALLAVALVLGVLVCCRQRSNAEDRQDVLSTCRLDPLSRQVDESTGRPVTAGDRENGVATAFEVEEEGNEVEESDEPQTEEAKREAEEEKQVNDFDNLTDKWMEPSANGVTMSGVDNFVNAFRQVPKNRKDECIHRALNLIPDENVVLLAGILMDKSMDKKIVEAIYNDILNRDENVKKPILQQIFKDESHPCWADTAWILDVTGELPVKK